MKVFAIQKTQTNTYAPRFTQDNSVIQNPIRKTSLSKDKFDSKVAFGAIIRSEILGKSVEELNETLPKLAKRFRDGLIPEQDYEDTVSAIDMQMRYLANFESGDSVEAGADMRARDID